VPEQRANELVTALERECDRVLVYVYPGWSNETLEILARRAGFDLSEVNGDVGMIKFQRKESEGEKEYKRIITPEIVGTPLPSFSLSDMLASRRWWSFSDPFPHIVAQNVFTESIYRDLETAFQAILSQGLSNQASIKQLTHTMKGYDAYGMSFVPDLTGPFSVFLSRAWHDMLAILVGVKATGDISGGLHHHSIGSASGHLHNDLNPGWFVDYPRADSINISHPELCSYHHGDTYKTGLRARETIRAVAMIYYLNNPPWQPGDGGETGLYRNASNPVDQPVAAVPPLNNSLLIFECTPYSYHSFIKNRRQPRNSVILWLHRPKAEVISRWGEEKIVYWPKR
jgi:2OG-Fe(II) oxygenase superfamily